MVRNPLNKAREHAQRVVRRLAGDKKLQEKQQKQFDRTIVDGPILKAVWKLAWPTMLQNIIAGFQGISRLIMILMKAIMVILMLIVERQALG